MLFGGNWNNGANCGSRCSNWNNAFSNSNNNIGGRAVCVCVLAAPYAVNATAWRVGCFIQSAALSSLGKYISGFGKTPSRKSRKAYPTFHGH